MKTSFARLAYLVAFVLVTSYALFALCGPRGIAALIERQRQVHTLENRNAALAQEIERKRDRIKRLEDSPSEQEMEIRGRLKLVHPDEKIFITGDPANK
jgi:cell division protein FtsB